MHTKSMLLALFVCTAPVIASPISGGLFQNDCDGKAVGKPCMPLDSLSLDAQGACVDVEVSHSYFETDLR
jgi:hypothetical protein